MLKLGSLFDGSGGFPLAGVLHGVEPVWASEIEPYPMRVTTARFPAMKHLGDVTKIDGAAIEPVDIITFGSPCQDLSVAGKQAGLHKGERSNLFFEAIRIIKEMREATDGNYPRIAVWENVPGAFSSNKGADFQSVLEAFAQVCEPTAHVPMPERSKWHPSGAIVGDGWSVAWRTLDAQFWGVPQRRRRIYLIADFGSERAGEILFEQESLRGHSAESGTAGKSAATDVERGAGRGGFGGIFFKERAGCPGGGKGILCGDKPFTLSTLTDQAVCYAIDQQGGKGVRAYDIGEARLRNPQEYIELSPTLTQRCGTGGNNTPAVCYAARTAQTQANGIGVAQDQTHTLDCANAQAVCYALHDHQIALYTKQAIGHYCELKVASTQQARQYKSADDLVVSSAKPTRKYIIRRLTPLECARLQGFPDDWCSGLGTENPTEDEIAFWAEVWETHRRTMGRSGKAKSRNQIIKWLKDPHSDAAEYKMWGNGLALPNAAHVVGCAVKLIKETQE